MKKEIVSVMMAACLFASLATGCGTANESETSSKSGSGWLDDVHLWNQRKSVPSG